MKKQLDLYSKSNKKFQMEGFQYNDIDEITVTTPGYIILPNGDYITIGPERHHKDVFEEYLNNYLETCVEMSDTINAVRALNEEGHVVFCGTRIGRINNNYGTSIQSKGFIFIPELERITTNQLSSIDTLLKTNVSLISRRTILDIVVATTKTNEEYNEFEFFDLVKASKKNI